MNSKEMIEKLDRIEAKLDEVIKALHEYDNDGYGESSFEAFQDETQCGPCSKHDEASWDEIMMNKRMNIIGQNGNEGLHYNSHHVTNEEADEDAKFNDYGQRVGKVKDNNNTQGKHTVGDKNKHTGGNKKKYKGKRKVDPIVKHEQFQSPHKH
jgi:hypothetical protein